ncbi:type II toxin-antitoxin system PemK/MazF family toxin [Coprococcus sp. RTP21204st1_G4_RTP21204_210225]|uniref:type II toxin-antitoxin system PemK/MazF family toxin n=1 Tax=Coprococcus sp. RTP21204st1_G4_RTP21204_210225 TaxID=3143207 RepID=UPI0034A44894
MEKYNIGDVWWIHFPYGDEDREKRRPAIIIDDDTIAILAMYVTSRNKENPYSIEIEDWKAVGLSRPSWTRIDKIVKISEWYMDRKIGRISEKDFLKIMQLFVEVTSGKWHEFSIIAVKNSDGEYLQRYDDRWKCWLFPYVRSTNENKENVDSYISKLLRKTVVTKYVTVAKHCKYSESDKLYKIYNHKLYEVLLDSVPKNMENKEFDIDNTKYKWMSITELEQDENVMEKNDDIIAFVKTKCR